MTTFGGQRVYRPFDDKCDFCAMPADWTVQEDEDSDECMQVCDGHKWTAFS
jgi:hypothetical protein